MQILGRGEIDKQPGIERARERRDEARDGECGPDVALDPNAEKFHAAPIFAQCHPGVPKRRLQQRPHDADSEAEANENQVIKIDRGESEWRDAAEVDVLPGEPGE